MTQHYEGTQVVRASAEDVFDWLSEVSNLPHYLPELKEARIEGKASSGKPGERISLRVGIPGRYEAEGEGYLHAERDELRMEWGSEMGRDYSGWLAVEERAQGECRVKVHLSFGPRSVEGQVQEESSAERDPMQESVDDTLESIRRQIEEGSGKLSPAPPDA